MNIDQNKTPLFTALKQFKDKNVISFDVPGHKKQPSRSPLVEIVGETGVLMDANSMKPLDNLSNPTSVIKEAQDLMAKAFNCDKAFFLVNGTTFGVQTMIMTVCKEHDKIIIPRNVHKSAINSLILCGANPIYVQPEINSRIGISLGVSYESYEKAILENQDAKAIFIVNPTYYGVVSDVKRIIDLAHKYNLVVLVDEAHGTHFYFNDNFPEGAMNLGADMAALSFHKTGGSLTQSSALLLNEKRVKSFDVQKMINLTQTTSASYLLMASLDLARKLLVNNGERIFDEIYELSCYARKRLNEINNIYAFGKELVDKDCVYDFDETKLSVCTININLAGIEVYDLLRDKYNIQVEFGDTNNILAIISVGDTKENIDKLIDAIEDISLNAQNTNNLIKMMNFKTPEVVLTPRKAFYSDKRKVSLEASIGLVSGESIMAYPPGTPIVSPGERIDEYIINYIKYLKSKGGMLTDMESKDMKYINVLDI